MKCPLFILNDRRAQSGEETEIGDCLKEECAWWDFTQGQCAILEIARKLNMGLDAFERIANGLRR